ncbi:MAG: FGGY-family carbohydrate kinase [Thermofilum sp.]
MYAVVDVGTTGVKLFLFNEELKRVHSERVELGFEKTEEGFVEQSSAKLAEVVRGFARKARSMGARKLGLCTYRASVLAWRRDGTPITNVVTWIDGRGREVVEKLPAHVAFLKKLSSSLSQILSPDSPAVLMRWILDHNPGLSEEVLRGGAFLWTLDSYLIYTLTGRFLADATNATLTGLLHPRNLEEISVVYSMLKLPRAAPEVVDNVAEFGSFEGLEVSAVIADQQSAALAVGAVERGRVESVHGTGSFVEQCTGSLKVPSGGLVPVVMLSLDGERTYGIEGFVRTTGSIVEWLRQSGFFNTYEEMNDLAGKGRREVLVVPAFGGFRCPRAGKLRGLVVGLSLGAGRAEVIAGLAWGVALHIALLLKEISKHAGKPVEPLWASGGYSKSDPFLQILSDVTGMRVARPVDVEASSRGVAKLLLLSDGKISKRELAEPPPVGRFFEPRADAEERGFWLRSYEELLEVVRRWEENPFLRGSF